MSDAKGLPRSCCVVSGKASGLASNTLAARHQTLTVPLCAVLRLESLRSAAPASIAGHRRSHGMIFLTWGHCAFPGVATLPTYRHPVRTNLLFEFGTGQPRMETCAVSTRRAPSSNLAGAVPKKNTTLRAHRESSCPSQAVFSPQTGRCQTGISPNHSVS